MNKSAEDYVLFNPDTSEILLYRDSTQKIETYNVKISRKDLTTPTLILIAFQQVAIL